MVFKIHAFGGTHLPPPWSTLWHWQLTAFSSLPRPSVAGEISRGRHEGLFQILNLKTHTVLLQSLSHNPMFAAPEPPSPPALLSDSRVPARLLHRLAALARPQLHWYQDASCSMNATQMSERNTT